MICELLPGSADFAVVEGIVVEWSQCGAGSWESWVVTLVQELVGDLVMSSHPSERLGVCPSTSDVDLVLPRDLGHCSACFGRVGSRRL